MNTRGEQAAMAGELWEAFVAQELSSCTLRNVEVRSGGNKRVGLARKTSGVKTWGVEDEMWTGGVVNGGPTVGLRRGCRRADGE